MPKVTVCVELEPERYRAFQSEAQRRGVTVESLLQATVEGMLSELEREETEGTDHPIIPG